ncbi:hypothetical protein HDU93_006761 [Gonapodya sp. JEL0774]|nr:hypothetical protein HDU93_006761 [Gonapodya sp. JEL0774]
MGLGNGLGFMDSEPEMILRMLEAGRPPQQDEPGGSGDDDLEFHPRNTMGKRKRPGFAVEDVPVESGLSASVSSLGGGVLRGNADTSMSARTSQTVIEAHTTGQRRRKISHDEDEYEVDHGEDGSAVDSDSGDLQGEQESGDDENDDDIAEDGDSESLEESGSENETEEERVESEAPGEGEFSPKCQNASPPRLI